MNKFKLRCGDNIELLKKLPDNSIDSIVSDPPYGLSFMNKKWDHDVPSVEFWKEVYRVLKPGGHVLSFGGTRTYHRLVVNIEDAGFEIRDQIQWIYSTGFPKSHNIGKAVDKRGGQSEWEGFGTALKPANEPICLARKPLSEKSVAENVLKWGTGGINIDGCRIGFNGDKPKECELVDFRGNGDQMNLNASGKDRKTIEDRNYIPNDEGRFPANIILECICDEVIKGEKGEVIEHNGTGGIWNEGTKEPVGRTYNDKGDIHTDPMCPCRLMDEQSGSSASRFFYQAKVSKKERNMGLPEGMKSTHPTMKPVQLMAYLCRMITPPGGTILDPFMGSGSTGIAAMLEGFNFIGFDLDPEYFKIAEARITNYEKYREFLK